MRCAVVALQIIGAAREQARKAEALGSIESLATCRAMTSVIMRCKLERARRRCGSVCTNARRGPMLTVKICKRCAGRSAAARDAEQRIRASDQSLAQLDAF